MAEIKKTIWNKARPDGPWIPATEWPFPSSHHFGEKVAFGIFHEDERGWEGPFETKEEAEAWVKE